MGRLKCTCLTFLILGLIPVSLRAQLNLGARGGLSLGHQKVDATTGPEDVNARSGVVAGLTLGYQVNPHVQLALGGRIAQKGGTQAQQGGVDALLRTTYLELPFSVQLFPSNADAFRPFVSAGGFLAFETDCDLRLEGRGQSMDVGCEEAADREKTDFGVLLGGGSVVDLGGPALMLEVEYALGLRDVSHTPSATVKTRTIYLTAGLKYAWQG